MKRIFAVVIAVCFSLNCLFAEEILAAEKPVFSGAAETAGAEGDVSGKKTVGNEGAFEEKNPAGAEEYAGVSDFEKEVDDGKETSADGKKKNDGDESADSEEETPEEKYLSFMDSVKKIRMLETDTDIFSASHNDSGKRQLVSFADGKFQRRFYDDTLRLEKIEYWRIESSSAASKMEREITYNAAKKHGELNSVFERNFSENTETRTFFYPNKKIKSRRNNYFDDKGILDTFEIFTSDYDASWRISQERRQKYSSGKKGVRLLNEQLTNYVYNGDKPSMTSFYENSILRLRIVYDSKNEQNFVRTTYFDGGLIIRDFYTDGIKVSSNLGGADEEPKK